MKRFLVLLLTVFLLCTSVLTTHVVLAEEDDDTADTPEVVREEDTEEYEDDSAIIEEDTESEEDIYYPTETEEDALNNENSENDDVSPTDGKAYAVLSSFGVYQNSQLTFFRSDQEYLDGEKTTVTDIYGNEYYGYVFCGIEKLTADDSIPWESYKKSIKNVRVASDQVIRPVSTAYWFSGCRNLSTFSSEGFDTSKTVDMAEMFYQCSNLQTLDLTGFNTSNVTDMSYMFCYCSSLESLNVSSFNTSKVKDMTYMFNICESLKELNLSNFNTPNVTDVYGMFAGCSSLENLNISSLNTSNVTQMRMMFWECNSLESLNLSSFNTAKVTSMEEMFSGCSSLKELNLSSFNTPSLLYMDSMFLGCSSLEMLNVSNFNTSKVKWMFDMFTDCSSLNAIFLGSKWTKWVDDALLPPGTWSHNSISKNEYELYKEYPSHASSWAGLWTRGGYAFNRISVNYHSNYENDEVVNKSTSSRTYLIDNYSLFFRDGYSLVAWNTSPDGKGTRLLPGKKLENYDDNNCLTLNLYAQWELTNYKKYTQKWVTSLKGAVEGEMGPGVHFTAGPAEIEYGVAKAAIKGEGGGSITVSKEHNNGIDKLTIDNTINAKVALKGSVGPTAKVGSSAMQWIPIDVSVGGNTAGTALLTSSLVIDNYSPRNLDQLSNIGRYLLGLVAECTGNTLYAKLYNYLFVNGDISSAKAMTELNFSVNGKVLELTENDQSMGSVLSGSEAVRVYTSATEIINENEYQYIREAGSETSKEFNALDFSEHVPILNSLNKNAMFTGKGITEVKLATTKKNDKLSSIAFTESSTKSNTIHYMGKDIKNSVSLTYEEDEAEKYIQVNDYIRRFADSKYSFVIAGGYSTVYLNRGKIENYKDIVDRAKASYEAIGKYEEKTEETDRYDIKMPIGAQAGIGVKLELDLLGTYGIEYLKKKGTIRGNDFLSSIEYNNRDQIMAETSEDDLRNMFKDSIDAVFDLYKEAIRIFVASVGDFINTGWSTLRSNAENIGDYLGRNMHIETLHFGRNSNSGLNETYQPYMITVYSPNSLNSAVVYASEDSMNCDASFKESKAYTVGDPVYVYLTDEEDNIIEQFEDTPLELTLMYDDLMLENAGISSEDAGNLYIYKYNEDLYGYICIGGTRNVEEKSVSATITEAGEYIIAADYMAPSVKDFQVSDYSAKPTISVSFDEASFFNEIHVSIDGEEIIDPSNWREYFNGSLNTISVALGFDLSEGEHTVTVYAVDSAGNVMELPLSYSFIVDITNPSISELSAKYDDSYIKVRLSCLDEDLDRISAKLTQTIGDETVEEEYLFDGVDNYYSCLLPYVASINDCSVVVTAYDTHENKTEQNVRLSQTDRVLDAINDLWYTLPDGFEYTYSGKAIKPLIKVYEGTDVLKLGTDYTVSYVNNANVSLDSSKLPTIIITGKGNYSSKDTVSFNIVAKDITDEDVSISELAAVVTNDKTQYLKPVVKWGKTALKINKDYTLSYSDADSETAVAYKDPGLYTVLVTGIGNYTGEAVLKYEIISKEQTLISKATLTKPKDIAYSGNTLDTDEFDVVLKDPKTKELLVKGNDYILDFSGNLIDIGTVVVKIIGIGEYKGTRTTSFKITGTALSKLKVNGFKTSVDYNNGLPVLQEELALVIVNKDKSQYVLQGIEKKAYDLLSEQERRGYDYCYEYEDNLYPGKAKLTLTGVNGYTGTLNKTFTIKGVALSKVKVSNLVSSFIYDGTEKLQSDIVLTYQKDKNSSVINLVPEEDYTVSYSNNTKAGTATVILTGKGLYTGTVKKTYKITPYDMSIDTEERISVYYPENVSYQKGGVKPEIAVYDGYTLLTEGTDYTVTFKNNTAVNDGTDPKKAPSFTIKGKGSYKGSLGGYEFVIVQRLLADDVAMTATDKVYSAKKNAWMSTPVLTDKGKKLVAGTDYDKKDVTYRYVSETVVNNGAEIRDADDIVQATDVIPAGTEIRVTVKGIKNYKDELSAVYRIMVADISKATVTVKAKEYTGKPVTLSKDDIVVKLNKQVIDSDNYEIIDSSYKNNINKGKASVILQGVNDLGSTKTVNYTIGAKALQWWFNLWQ